MKFDFVKNLIAEAKKEVAAMSLMTEDFTTSDEDAQAFWRAFGANNKAKTGRLNWDKNNMWWSFTDINNAKKAEKRLNDIVGGVGYDIVLDGMNLRLGWKNYDPSKEKTKFIKRGKISTGKDQATIDRFNAMKAKTTKTKPVDNATKG